MNALCVVACLLAAAVVQAQPTGLYAIAIWNNPDLQLININLNNGGATIVGSVKNADFGAVIDGISSFSNNTRYYWFAVDSGSADLTYSIDVQAATLSPTPINFGGRYQVGVSASQLDGYVYATIAQNGGFQLKQGSASGVTSFATLPNYDEEQLATGVFIDKVNEYWAFLTNKNTGVVDIIKASVPQKRVLSAKPLSCGGVHPMTNIFYNNGHVYGTGWPDGSATSYFFDYDNSTERCSSFKLQVRNSIGIVTAAAYDYQQSIFYYYEIDQNSNPYTGWIHRLKVPQYTYLSSVELTPGQSPPSVVNMAFVNV